MKWLLLFVVSIAAVFVQGASASWEDVSVVNGFLYGSTLHYYTFNGYVYEVNSERFGVWV